MHEAYTSAKILDLPKALSIESIFRYCLETVCFIKISPNHFNTISQIIPSRPTLSAFHLIFPVFSYGDNLFIGTAQGSLLQYTVATRPGGPPDVQILRANKNFSRRPITQISVVPEDEILVTIKEGVVSVHDISETHISLSFVYKVTFISPVLQTWP